MLNGDDDLSASAEMQHNTGRARILHADDDATTDNNTNAVGGANTHGAMTSHSEIERREAESLTNGGED